MEVNLSKREEQVLRLLAEGKTDKQIGRDLALSASTVETYVQRLQEKTGTANRFQLGVRAALDGLVALLLLVTDLPLDLLSFV